MQPSPLNSVTRKEPTYVLVGALKSKSDVQSRRSIDHDLEQVFKIDVKNCMAEAPQYESDGQGNVHDYAIIKLPSPIKFNKYVAPICLADDRVDYGACNCYISGIHHYKNETSKLLYRVLIH